MGAWVAAFFSYGFAFAPKAARFIASIFAIETISDYLNHDYEATKSLSHDH